MGREADAERTEASAAAIAKPVADWRAQRGLGRNQAPPTAGQQRNAPLVQERAGILAGMLLPALGEWPEAPAYEPERMLEYGVFTEVVIAMVLVGALLLIVAWCLPAAPGGFGRTLALVGLGLLAACLVVGVLLGVSRGLAGQRQHGQFYGSIFRVLVLTLALSIIVLGVVARPLQSGAGPQASPIARAGVTVPVPERGIHPPGRRGVAGAREVSAGLRRGRHSRGLKSALRSQSRPT
jgi:hypothetical protein